MNGVAALALAIGVVLVSPARAASAPDPAPQCSLDRMAGRILSAPGPVTIKRNNAEITVPVPACILVGDVVPPPTEGEIHIALARGRPEILKSSSKPFEAPHLPDPPHTLGARLLAVAAVLGDMVTSPTRRFTIYAASRDVTGCPPGTGTPPALAALEALRAPAQRVGSDLTSIVVGWEPSEAPRLASAKLLTQDGQRLAFAATCRNNLVALHLERGALHPGMQLALTIADESDAELHIAVTVVDPAELAYGARGASAWLAAAERVLVDERADLGLDALSRIAAASTRAFGAQLLLARLVGEAPSPR